MMPVTVDDIMNETPEDYAIRTAIPLQQAQTPAGAATQGIAFDELPDETYVRATSGSNKPEDQFDPLASLRGIVQPVLDNGQLGAAQITRGTTGVQALLGRVEYEAVKDDANARSMQALTLATQKADEGLWALDPRKFINATAQALPFLGATIGAGLAGAAGGAAVGAGAGLLGGPFAEVTVPGGALAGAKIGYDAGSASFSAAVMGGQTYMDLRDAGLSHETSRVGGIAAGIVMGAIERLQLHQLTGIGRKAVADQLATPAGKRALLQIVREGATVYGQQIAEEEAQEVAGILTQVIGSVAEGNSDAMPKLYDPAKPDDPNTILNRLKNTLVQTAYAVPGLAATSHVAGVATGKAVSAALGPNKTEVNTKGAQVAPVAAAVQKAKVGVSTVAEALALIKEGFAKPAPTAEAIKQTKEATMADTLDALVKPGVDEKGKVVQTETGPQIQASVTKEAPAAAKPVNNKTLFRGQMDPTQSVTDKNISTTRSIADFIPAMKQMEKDIPTAGLVYFTESENVAKAYADQEKNIFKSMLAQNGQNREQTMEQFQILYGRPPKLEGRVIKQDVNVGKVLDLSDLGETPDFDTVVKRLLAEEGSPIPKFSTADGGVNSPTYDRFWELEKLFGLSKKYADPEGNDIATFKLMRNVDEAENSGNEFVKWVRDLGYDSVRYASQGTNHFAIINFDELQSSAKEAPAPTEPVKPTLETKGRETNVKDTLKTIDAAINDAERALISATADEKPTAAIMNKLDTLYAKRGVAQLELEQLAAGAVTDVSGADITIKADRITALRAKAAKDAIKKFQQGVREGSKTARDTVKLVQAEVDSLIRASDLPAKDKGKFLARLRSITTEAQLTRALPEIKQRLDALIEKDAMRSAKRDLKRVLKQASERKAKRPEGKYTADVQTILDTYTQMIADPAKVEAALNVENPTGEREQLNKLIAEQVGDLENKNSDGVQRLADEIRSVIETGKSKRIEKTIAAKLETQALIADVTTSINGDKPVDSPSMATSKLRLKKWGDNWLLKLDRAAGRFISTWADLMDIISQNDKTHAMVELMDVFPTIVEEEANQRKQFDAAIETLVDAVDPKPGESRKKTRQRVLNRLVEGGARVQDFGTFTDPDGREANLVVTRNEAAAIYAQSFDPDAAAGWDATYTRPDQVLQGQVSTLELLEKSLDDLDKQLVQGVINHFDGYHARINAAWEDETGATLPKNPFYSGQLRRVLENGEIEVVTAFNDYAAQSSLKPGSTIKRTKNANPLAPTDLYVNMFRQLHETEHWLAWRKTAKRLNVLRKNSKVRNTIELKYGAGMLRTIDLHIDNMLQTKIKANEEAHKWLRHFRHNAGTAFVGGKALSAAKQFSSVLLFADYVSVPGYIAGVIDFFANPLDLARKIKILESSEHLKSRNTTMDVSTMDMIQSTDTKQFKTGMRFTDFLMLPVKFGDKATIWAGGWAVYAETLKKTKSHDQAIAAFERAFNATQSSGTTDQQTQLEASGEFGKAISLFTKNSVQIVNMERKALRRAIAQPSAKNIYHAAKTLAITRFSQILFQLASATPYIAGGDEDKIEEQLYKLFRAAMFGAWTGLPLVGDVLDSAGTVMTNITFDAKEKIWTPEFLPLEAAGDALTAFKNAAENLLADGQHNWDKIVGDGLSTWALVAPKAAGGGLPVTPLWSASKEFLFPEDDTGGNAPNLK